MLKIGIEPQSLHFYNLNEKDVDELNERYGLNIQFWSKLNKWKMIDDQGKLFYALYKLAKDFDIELI